MNQVTENEDQSESRIDTVMSLSLGNREMQDPALVYKGELIKWVNKGVVYLFFFLFLQTSIVTDIAWTVSLVPLFYSDFKILSKNFTLSRNQPLYKYLLAKDVVHQFCSAIFKIMLVFHIHVDHFYSVFLIVPVSVTCIYDIISRAPSVHECEYMTWLITLISKWIFLLVLLNVALELEHVINWKWNGILWPAFLGLSLCAVIIVGIALFALGSLLSWVADEISNKEFLSTLWLLFSVVGSFLALLSLCTQITNPDYLKLYDYYPVVPIVFLSVFITATFANINNLIDWWIMFFSQTDTSEASVTPENLSDRPSTIRQRITLAVKKAPHMLMRISSSYFQPVESPKKKTNKKAFSLRFKVEEKEEQEEETVTHRRIFSNPTKTYENDLNSPTLVKKIQICHMCCEKDSNAVIMECGHGGICYECSLEMWKSTGNCHMCRSPISQVLQIELALSKTVKVSSTTRAVYCDNE